MFIIRDKDVENSRLYEQAMFSVQPILDKKTSSGEITPENYWEIKKELLKGHGVDWKTPAELNPELIK